MGGEEEARPARRRAAIGFVLSVLVVCAVCGLVGWLLGDSFAAAGRQALEVAGPWGLVGAVTAAEASPIPLMGEPFLLLAHEGGMPLSTVIWLGIAGNLLAAAICYGGGRLLGRTGLARRLLGERHEVAERLVREQGAWALVLASLTPLPFGTLAWVAGALDLPAGTYALACLVRIPKVVGYVLIMTGAVALAR